jgi:hypothetical protein
VIHNHYLHAIGVFFLYHVCFYVLRKTEVIAARSTGELLTLGFRQLFTKGESMKTVFSALGGALVLTEEGGVLTLSLDESLGGGAAAGVLKGQASVVLDAANGVKLGEAALNGVIQAKAPALLPLAEVVEGVANQALQALE